MWLSSMFIINVYTYIYKCNDIYIQSLLYFIHSKWFVFVQKLTNVCWFVLNTGCSIEVFYFIYFVLYIFFINKCMFTKYLDLVLDTINSTFVWIH